MRFARLIGPIRQGARVSSVLAWAVGAGVLSGCQYVPQWLDPNRSFLDPGEVGRFKHEPLILRIMDHVDAGIEEPNTEFVNAVPPTAEDLVVSAGDYVISKNDLLNIEIGDLTGPGTQTVKTTRVSESGNISLPFIGQLHAEGLTEIQLEQAIKDKYKSENIIQNAQISVAVAEARGRAISILGAVGQPGQYAIVDPDFRVLDALVLARDTTSPLLEDLYIIRRTDKNQPAAGGSGTRPASAPTAPEDLAPRGSLNGTGLLKGRPLAALRPTPDVTRVGTTVRERAIMAAAGPDDLSPATTRGATPVAPIDPALPPAGPAKGRTIYVDGKPVFIADESVPATTPATRSTTLAPTTLPATAGGDLLAPTPMAEGARPMTSTVPATSTPHGGKRAKFEFNELTAPDNLKIIHIPLDRLRNGELQYNVVVKPKDVIIVQQLPIGEYYMSGHVQRPGAYTLSQRRITLKQAIASANGLDSLAMPDRTDVIRRLGRDKEVFIRVDLAKIFNGQQADMYLKPDDQVVVGTALGAPFLAAIRGAFRLTYGFGFLYDRNFAVDEERQNF